MQLSKRVRLPREAVTQTFGILAVRGAGKSNAAVVVFEEMVRAGHQAVTIDPVGAWWGVRSSADGRGPGLEVPIFGGRHGDVDLKPDAGVMLADLLVDERLPAVLDVSEFGKAERLRFLTAFGERLYRRNRDPLHLILEEADDYVPQKPAKGPALACLSVFQDVVRRGRSRGLGITMVTQRSAVIHKDVLTQIETLIVLRTTSPQDRRAIAAWVDQHGQARELLESLPHLKAGEAWVWSPHFLDVMERVQFRRRSTFDSGATPTGRGRRVAKMADVDLGAIEAKMVTAVREAQLRDPKRLRARIHELQRALDSAQTLKPDVVVKERLAVKPAEARRLRQTVLRLLKQSERLEQTANVIHTAAIALGERLAEASRGERVPEGSVLGAGPESRSDLVMATPGMDEDGAYTGATRVDRVPFRIGSGPDGSASVVGLSPYAEGLLRTLVERHPVKVTRVQLGTLSGKSHRSSAYRGALRELSKAGFVQENGDGRLELTANAQSLVDQSADPKSPLELRAMWLSRLPAYEAALLRAMLDGRSRGSLRDEVAARAGKSTTSSAFRQALRSLVKNGLVREVSDGRLVASDDFYEEIRT